MMFHKGGSLLRVSVVSFQFLFGLSCTSTRSRVGSSVPPSSSALESNPATEQNRYEAPVGVVSARVAELDRTAGSTGSVKEILPAPSERRVADRPQVLRGSTSLPELLILQAGGWKELLEKTETRWSDCVRLPLERSEREECRGVGRARSIALVRLGLPEDAWRNWDVLLKMGPEAADALVFSSLYLESGSPELCARLSTLGEQWEPTTVASQLRALRIKCLRTSGEFQEARSVTTQSLVENPQDSGLQFESALLFLSEKNLTQGCDILERLFLNHERQLAVFYNWGQCLIQRRDSDALKSVLERGRMNWPSESIWILLEGELALLEGRFEMARQSGLDYLATAPGHDEFRPQAYRLSRVLSED
jgi:tetratricopeptide (TPR) repeat protein